MKTMTCVLASMLLASFVVADGIAAQVEAPALWLVPESGDVIVQLSTVPAGFQGFHVYRAPPGAEPVRLTTDPVQPARGPAQFLAAIGDAAGPIMDRMEAVSEVDMVRRLRSSDVSATLYGFFFPEVAGAQGRVFRDTTAAPGAEYQYRVEMVDARGEETGESRSASVTVEDRLPEAPGALEAEPQNGRVELRWSYPDYAGDPGDLVVGFHLYRAVDASDVFERVTNSLLARNDAGERVWMDRDVRNGRSYRYVIRAVDIVGRVSGMAGPVSVTPENPAPPLTPVNLRLEPGEGRVALEWQRSPELDVVGYRVTRSPGLAAPFQPITEELIPVGTPQYVDSTATGGEDWFYRVVAVDDQGRESAPTNPSSTVPRDDTPPAAPDSLTATVEARTVVLAWEPVGDAGVAGYHVYRAEGPGTRVRVTARPVPGTTFRDAGPADTGLVPGATYQMSVAAVDSMDNESAAVETTIRIPDDEAPAMPSSLALENPTGREIVVRWNASPARDVAAYEIERAAVTDDAATEGTSRTDTTSAVSARRLRHADVTPGVLYRYGVVAVDGAGNRSPAVTDSIRFADGFPPPRPVFTEAVAGASGVRVRWERVQADDLVGYRVERAELPTGTWSPVSEVVLPGGPLEMVDPGGEVGAFYRVRALDTSGNLSEPGPAVRAGGAS